MESCFISDDKDLITECIMVANNFLYDATVNNNILGVQEALTNGANVNHLHAIGGTALYMAVEQKYYNVAKILLDAGADTEIPTTTGIFPLYASVDNHDYRMTELLLDKGAKTETVYRYYTPLFAAAHFGYDDLIELLLSKGADKSFIVNYSNSMKESAYSKHPVSFKLLVGNNTEVYMFDREGVKEVALIQMIKNEEDIIFENLAWHFACGFRKFIIIDNMSTDRTKEKIQEFAILSADYAKVIIIEDPIFEHIQGRIITGSYNLALSVWPELTWVFPSDADEFWVPKQSLREIIAKIPDDIDALRVFSIRYYASEDYYFFEENATFYEKLHYQEFGKEHVAKIVTKAQNCIKITQGNHDVEKLNNCSPNMEVNYGLATTLGLEMYEFPIRSPKQIHQKYFNGMKANMRGKELGVLEQHTGLHWDKYAEYIDKYGNQSGEVRFNDSFVDLDYVIDSPLLIGKAIEFFCEIVGCQLS